MNIYDIKIGDIITPRIAFGLAEHFGLDYIVKRLLKSDMDGYRSFTFDGASCLPDQLVGLLVGIDWEKLTYLAAMPHDIAYWAGTPGDEIERQRVDLKFKSDLITKCGMKPWLAEVFYRAVRVGGAELGASFSWAFGHKERTNGK